MIPLPLTSPPYQQEEADDPDGNYGHPVNIPGTRGEAKLIIVISVRRYG